MEKTWQKTRGRGVIGRRMRWKSGAIGDAEPSRSLVRVFRRAGAAGCSAAVAALRGMLSEVEP
jgi:hypothetical protein